MVLERLPVVAGFMQLAHIAELAERAVWLELRSGVLVDEPVRVVGGSHHVEDFVPDALLDALGFDRPSER
jgi:hypothetical protein